MVFVGYDHHLAAPNGYAYEHRVIAEHKLGRRLRLGEIVHHIDRNKQNNSPENIEIDPSRWHHNARHRRLTTPRQDPDQPNEMRACDCGCGTLIWRFNESHMEVQFVSGHNGKLKKKERPPKAKQGAYLAARTHCPAGHEYSQDNTRIGTNNLGQRRRICRACHRNREVIRRASLRSK